MLRQDEQIEHACEMAVGQIKQRRYAQGLEGYRTVLSYGIAFKGKQCLVKVLTERRATWELI